MISLRDVVQEDCDQILAWRNSPEVARHMYGDHKIREEEHRAWFAGLAGDRSRKVWIIEHDGRGIGVASVYGIDLRNQRATWAFYLGDTEARNLGAGYIAEVAVLSYVFDVVKLHKLCCEVLAENEPVWRMHEKVGFRREGVFASHIFKDGRFHDVVALAMMRPEWQTLREAHLRRMMRRGRLISSPDTPT